MKTMDILLNESDYGYLTAHAEDSATASALIDLLDVHAPTGWNRIINGFTYDGDDFMASAREAIDWDIEHDNINRSVMNASVVAMLKIGLCHDHAMKLLDDTFMDTTRGSYHYARLLFTMFDHEPSVDELVKALKTVDDWLHDAWTHDFFTRYFTETNIVPYDIDALSSIMEHVDVIPSPSDAVRAYVLAHDMHPHIRIGNAIRTTFITSMEYEEEQGTDMMVSTCVALLYFWNAAKMNRLLEKPCSSLRHDANVLMAIRSGFSGMRDIGVEFGFEQLRGCYERH